MDTIKAIIKLLPQILATASATLSMISDGMQVSWTGPLSPVLSSNDSPIKVCPGDITWLETCFVLGGFFGLPLLYLVNKIGRKKVILLLNILRLIGWVLIATTTSVKILIVGRIFNGAAYYATMSVVPSYIAEIADKNVRGTLGSFCAVNLTIGYIVINAIIPALTIQQSSFVGLSFVVVTLITFIFMPDTPTYFLWINNALKAKRAMQKLKSTQNVEEELYQLTIHINNQKNSQISCKKIMMQKNSRWALIILSVLIAVKCTSGISPILMNMNTLLINGQSSISPNVIALISTVGMLVIGCTTFPLLDYLGRKIVFISSSILAGTSMFLLAMYFSFLTTDSDNSPYEWIPGVLVVSFMYSYRYGIGTVPFVLVAELLPANLKTVGMSVTLIITILCNVLALYVYESLIFSSGYPLPLLIFAGCCYFGAIFTTIFVPETKQKSLEEIQLLLKGENRSSFGKTKYGLTDNSTLSISDMEICSSI